MFNQDFAFPFVVFGLYRCFSRIFVLLAQFKTGISPDLIDCGKESFSSLCNPSLIASLPLPVMGT
jgi:hypothetical protein